MGEPVQQRAGEPFAAHDFGAVLERPVRGDDEAETFPIVKRHDVKQFGHYRTKDLILHYYNAYAAGDLDAQVSG